MVKAREVMRDYGAQARALTSPIGRSEGFTLIEVMVVVVIISILINFAVLSMRSHTPLDQVKEESLRLKSLIHVASEEAQLRSSLIGIDITETGYTFLQLEETDSTFVQIEEATWQPVDDTLFRNRELPEEVTLSVTSAQPSDDDEKKLTPEIMLLNSGEITPFDLKIKSIHSDQYYRLSGDETGELSLDLISPY
jgi:general secretion pathway protein H